MRSLVTRLTVLEQLTILVAVIVFSLSSLLITARALRNERRAFVTSSATRLAAGLDDEGIRAVFADSVRPEPMSRVVA